MFQASSPEAHNPAGMSRRINELGYSNGYIGSLWLPNILRTVTIEMRIHSMGLESIDELPNFVSMQVNRALGAMGPETNFQVCI